jgi:hypothetical protein
MANSGNRIKWEAIREIAGTAITGSYAVLGGVLTRDSFRIWLTNNSNGDVYISTDGVTDMLKLPAQSGRAYDNKTNDMFVGNGTQFYIRYDVVPGSPAGWFTLEVEYV